MIIEGLVPDESPEITLVIHGFACKKIFMYPFVRRLRNKGLTVINWGYPSLTQDIQYHADR